MTKKQITVLLERAEEWPAAAQEELARAAINIERKHAIVYRLNGEERDDIRKALAEIERGEVASRKDVKKTFDDLRSA